MVYFTKYARIQGMTQLFTPSAPDRLRVDIWSDVACPWCYIGKRRFEQALTAFPHRVGDCRLSGRRQASSRGRADMSDTAL